MLLNRGADPTSCYEGPLVPPAPCRTHRNRSPRTSDSSRPGPERALAGEVAIEFFEVPPDEDEGFLAAWAAEGGGALFRAIREDVRCRFVAVSAGGDYQLVREDGFVQESGGVVLVHECDEPPELPTGRRGYIGSRLYRGAEGYVEIAWWSSPLMVFRAQRPGDLYVTATPSRTSD